MLQRLSSLVYLGVSLLLLTMAACDFAGNVEQAGSLTPTAVSPEADATPAPASGVAGSTVLTSTEDSAAPPILKIWIPADPPGLADEDADIFVSKLGAFANSPAEVETIVQEKALSGPGGILSYLRTGRGIADSALPDLVILPADQLPIAAADELVYPLEEFVDRERVLQQLYPAAVEMGQVDGELMGYPFALTNLTHLAYDPTVITQTVPLRWTEFVSTTNPSFAFPASGSSEAATLAFQLYQSLGGELSSESGQPAFMLGPLTNALGLLQSARLEHDFVTVDSLNLSTYHQAWESFRNGSATLLLTTVEAYWQHRSVEPLPTFQPVPGLDTSLTPLVDGWVVVLTATEPRRPLAADFLQTIVSTPNVAEWSANQALLPANQEALALWIQDDAYLAFLQTQLSVAEPNPLTAEPSLMLALQNGVFEVLSLAKLPNEAAQQIVDGITQ